MRDVILKNKNGVRIIESEKLKGHYIAENATCSCDLELRVAPLIFHPKNEPSDPVMVCADFGVCQYKFSDLITGKQKSKGLRP